MPRKKKASQRFSAIKAIKSLARERLGVPPPAKIESRKPKTGKHKPSLEDLMRE